MCARSLRQPGRRRTSILPCRTLARDAPDAIIFADAKGLIRFWNTGAQHIFGWSAAEALGRSLDIIIPAKLRERHWQGYRQATVAHALSSA